MSEKATRLSQHLVESVLAAVAGKVLEHLNEQEERGGVYLADLHQHFGKVVGVMILISSSWRNRKLIK